MVSFQSDEPFSNIVNVLALYNFSFVVFRTMMISRDARRCGRRCTPPAAAGPCRSSPATTPRGKSREVPAGGADR